MYVLLFWTGFLREFALKTQKHNWKQCMQFRRITPTNESLQKNIIVSPNIPHRLATPGLGQVFRWPNSIRLSHFSQDDFKAESNRYPLVIELRSIATEKGDPKFVDLKYQFTFASIIRQNDGSFAVKTVKQKIQLNGNVFEIADIYGVDNVQSTVNDQQQQQTLQQPSNEDSCVVCMSASSDTAVLPCRHMCICFDCAQMLRIQTNKVCNDNTLQYEMAT